MKTGNYERNGIIEAAILFSLFYLPGYLFQSPSADPRSFDSIMYNFQLWILFLPRIALLILIVRREGLTGFRDFGLTKPSAGDIPRLFMLLASVAALAALIQLLSRILPFLGNPGDFQWKISRASILPVIFITSMITGYSEEFFFRSYLYTRLEQIGGEKAFSLLITNLLFSTGHYYEGPAGIVNAFMMGSLFSLFFIRRRNIHIPAVVHGLYNFTALLLSLFM